MPGEPKPQGSKRAIVQRGRAYLVESCRGLGEWRSRVALAAAAVIPAPLGGAVCVVATFRFSRPKSHLNARGEVRRGYGHMTCRPDVDKLLRGLLDGLAGVAFRDDSQVVSVTANKTYADNGHAGAEIHIVGVAHAA